MNPTRTKTPEQVERRAAYLRGKLAGIQKELDQIAPASAPSSPRPATPEAFKDLNLLIGIPAYGGLLQNTFVASLIVLSQSLVNLGIPHQIKILGNQSLITLARNHLANAVFDGDTTGKPFTHLLFIDSDQGFQASDVISMIFARKEIIGLPVCYKSIEWNQVAEAARRGVPPAQLPQFVGRTSFVRHDMSEIQIDKLARVKAIGTGILLIARTVLEKMMNAHPTWTYQRNSDDTTNPKRERDFDFFQTSRDEETGLYLGEDQFFCRTAGQLGVEIWMIPSAVTAHIGTYQFIHNLPALAWLSGTDAPSKN